MDPVVHFGPTQDIPGAGLYAASIDTEGDRPSMLQPSPPAAID